MLKVFCFLCKTKCEFVVMLLSILEKLSSIRWQLRFVEIIYHCWTTVVLKDCLTWERNVVSSNNALESCGGTLHQTERPKAKFWSMSLNVICGLRWGDRWGWGQAQGCYNASCLSTVVRCGHVVCYRYKRLLKYQILQNTRDLFSSNRNISCEPSYPLLQNLNIHWNKSNIW